MHIKPSSMTLVSFHGTEFVRLPAGAWGEVRPGPNYPPLTSSLKASFRMLLGVKPEVVFLYLGRKSGIHLRDY